MLTHHFGLTIIIMDLIRFLSLRLHCTHTRSCINALLPVDTFSRMAGTLSPFCCQRGTANCTVVGAQMIRWGCWPCNKLHISDLASELLEILTVHVSFMGLPTSWETLAASKIQGTSCRGDLRWTEHKWRNSNDSRSYVQGELLISGHIFGNMIHVYAYGYCDIPCKPVWYPLAMQGPVLCVLHAIEAYQQTGKDLPINFKVRHFTLVHNFIQIEAVIILYWAIHQFV